MEVHDYGCGATHTPSSAEGGGASFPQFPHVLSLAGSGHVGGPYGERVSPSSACWYGEESPVDGTRGRDRRGSVATYTTLTLAHSTTTTSTHTPHTSTHTLTPTHTPTPTPSQLRFPCRFSNSTPYRQYLLFSFAKDRQLALLSLLICIVSQIGLLVIDHFLFAFDNHGVIILHSMTLTLYVIMVVLVSCLPGLCKNRISTQRVKVMSRTLHILICIHSLVVLINTYVPILGVYLHSKFKIATVGELRYRSVQEYYFNTHIVTSFLLSTPLFPIHHLAFKVISVLVCPILFYPLYFGLLEIKHLTLFDFIYYQLICSATCLVLPLFPEWMNRTSFLNQRITQQKSKQWVQATKTANQLLCSLVPPRLVTRLRSNPHAIAERIPQCTILYADILGFTSWCHNYAHSPKQIVGTLHRLFKRFDRMARKYHVDLVYTIGDCYVASAGVSHTMSDHAARMLRFASSLLRETEALNRSTGQHLQIRIGIGTGTVISAVLGTDRFNYDVFGPASSEAKLMESTGQPGQVHVSQATRNLIGFHDRHREKVRCEFVEGPRVAGFRTFFAEKAKKRTSDDA
eukprot:gnl/Trimastix_PCT/4171.p1 GENE.gnl/Trimastix_PCT/4171~~gnl/Trimastix_PCT/4171.p1  ORF type:complete len:643 (+),score=66.82 gnl/Trimastix_PCT/4171:214-1929(+)